MSEYLIPEKVRIINNSANYPATYYDAAKAVVAPGSAVELDITGYGKVKTANLLEAKLVRGLSSALNSFEVNAATPAEITVAGAIPNDTRVTFLFRLETVNREMRLARPEYEFGETLVYNVNLKTGDTANIVLAKLYNSIMFGKHRNRDFLVTAVGTGSFDASGRATTLTKLEFSAVLPGTFIKWFKAEDVVNTDSEYVTVFNPTQTQAMIKGINDGSVVEFREKLIGYNNTPYFYDFPEIPIEGQLYTSVYFKFKINRPDPKSPHLSETVAMLMYLNESTCGAYIDNLADFFNTFSDTVLTANVSGGSINPGHVTLYTVGAVNYDEGVSLVEFKANA